MRPQYAGRDASASPATGLAKRHAAEQAALIAAALGHGPSDDKRARRLVRSPRNKREDMATDVEVPALGESITEGTLAQWLKKPGEAVAADEPIASLETDKVSVEVPSPIAGVLTEQLVERRRYGRGRRGDCAHRRERDGRAAAAAPRRRGRCCGDDQPGGRRRNAGAARDDAAAPVAEADADDDQITTLSPAVRRAVLEYHVDPTSIRGTGKDGRLTKDDVIAAAQAKKPPRRRPGPSAAGESAGALAPTAPAPRAWTPASAGERKEERVKMSRLRQTIASRLKEAQNTAAMLTTFNDVDMSAVIDARARYKDLFEKKHGIRLGFMGFFVKAVRARRKGRAVGQREHRRRRDRLSRLSRRLGRGVRAQGPGRPGRPQCRPR